LQAFPPFCTELDPQHLDQVITNLMQLSCIRPRFGVVPRPVNGVVPNAFKPLYLPYIWMIVSDDASSFLNPRSWTSWRGQRVFLWNLRAPFISSSNGSLLLPFDDSKTSRAAQGGGGGFKDSFFFGEFGCCDTWMTERTHWWTERWLRLWFVVFYISLSRSLFSSYLFLLFNYLSATYRPIYLSTHRSIDRSICLSI
jgi:hypothetical protein